MAPIPRFGSGSYARQGSSRSGASACDSGGHSNLQARAPRSNVCGLVCALPNQGACPAFAPVSTLTIGFGCIGFALRPLGHAPASIDFTKGVGGGALASGRRALAGPSCRSGAARPGGPGPALAWLPRCCLVVVWLLSGCCLVFFLVVCYSVCVVRVCSAAFAAWFSWGCPVSAVLPSAVLPSVASLRASGLGAFFLRPSARSASGWVAVCAPGAPAAWSFVGGSVAVPVPGLPCPAAVPLFAAWWAARLPAACAGVVVRRGLVSVPVSVR